MDPMQGASWLSPRQQRFLTAADPDSVLLDDFRELIERASPRGPRPASGGMLRVLLLGYAGAGNTGADVRVVETIRQLRRLFPERVLELSVFACGDIFDHPDLRAAKLFTPGMLYLPEAFDTWVENYDLVINAEGSTYTSKFSDALAALLIGGVGLAAARGRLACAYGVDSGAMTERLTQFAKATAGGVEIVCRSRGAQKQLAELGLASQLGADTAWSFRARPGARPAMLPERYAILCPNNPFWWPVYTDVRRAIELDARCESSPLRYGPLYFHTWDDLRAARFAGYKRTFAAVAEGFARRGLTPVLVAMERLDRVACDEIAALLPFKPPVLSRDTHDLDEIVATIEQAQWAVTTRYHASVLAIANRVPVIGVSMDTRIDQLFGENGLQDWVMPCEGQWLADRILERVDAGMRPETADELSGLYERLAGSQTRAFDDMGTALRRLVEGA